MLTIQFLCPLPNGLHARPAWELKEQCSQWQSEVIFLNHRQNARADAKSSLALIGTGTLFNDSCSLTITGRDEEQARRALEEYLLHRFIDSDSVQPTEAELAAHPLPRSLIRLNPDLLYGTVLAGGVGAGSLTLWQSDNLESYRAIAPSAEDNTRLEHSLATLAEQLNQQLREREGESKNHPQRPSVSDSGRRVCREYSSLNVGAASGVRGGDYRQYGAGVRQAVGLR